MRTDRALGALLWVAAGAATASIVAEYGFVLPGDWTRRLHLVDFIVVSAFVMEALVRLLVVRDPIAWIRRHPARYVIVSWLIFELAVWANFGSTDRLGLDLGPLLVGKIYLVVAQGYLVLEALIGLGRLHGRLARVKVPVVMIGPLPFLILIAVGTALLSLPRCRASSVGLLDTMFTATSAVCVTGLATRNIATDLTITGQSVVLVLIQVGGLGVMTVTAFLAAMQGELRGRGHALLLDQLLGEHNFRLARRLLVRIVSVVAVVELTGAFLLHGLAPGWSWFEALFHSISAFCNAGFSTFSAGLEPFAGNARVLLPVAALVVLGGLGFPVVLALPRAALAAAFAGGVRLPSWHRQVLLATVFLVLGGWAAFTWLPVPGGPVDALFQSVTTRTAGFSSFAQTALTPAALAVAVVLMIVGGAPFSTAGGVKVTTVTLLLAGRRGGAERLAARAMARAMVLFYLATAAAGTGLLVLSQSIPLREAVFETVSALSTVGLDRGVTVSLSPAGKAVVIVLMVLGRVGLVSVLMAWVLPVQRRRCGGCSPDVPVG